MNSNLYQYKHSTLLFFITALLLLSGLDKIDVNIMEARNFISAREMVQNKEYLLTTLNNEPRYQKPPLPTWLTAASGVVFGFDSLFALRLPVVAITFMLVLVFFHFSKRLGLSTIHSMNNGLILITSFYIFFAGRDNQWDMYTHSFMIVSIYFIWKVFQEDSFCLSNSLLSGLFLGFSILSKGPISLYSLFLPFLISYTIIYHISLRRKGLYLLIILLTGLVIGVSWYIYVRLKDPESFGIIITHETSNWISYELKPFYYYWSFFLQSGLWGIASFIAMIYPYLKDRVKHLKGYQFALVWTLVSLIMLSLIPEKKIRYLVPVLIPLALTTGFYIEYLFLEFNEGMSKWEKRLIYFAFGVFAFIAFAYPFAIIFTFKDKLQDYLFLFMISSILMVICSLFTIKGLKQKDFEKVFYSMIGIFTIVVISLIPTYKEVFYNPLYASTNKAKIIEVQYHIKTYSLSTVAPEIVWDFGKTIPIIKKKDSIVLFPEERKFGLMVDIKDSLYLKKHFTDFKIEKIYQINLHNKKNKRGRLTKDYYILSNNQCKKNSPKAYEP